MNPGDTVYYWDTIGGRFGHLVKKGYKWAHVRHGEKVVKIPVSDIRKWPPEGEWQAIPAKRGRA